MPDTSAVIVAAGAGERLGGGVPKAFVELAGEPLVLRCVRVLARVVDSVVCVVAADHRERAEQLLDTAGAGDVRLAIGGETRQDSVSAGLAACPPSTRVVAVHDAARPLLSEELARRTLDALQPPWDGVAPGLPLVDTIKLVDPQGKVLRTVDRRGMWAVQTPQVFPRAVLERVHARVASDADAATDDLSLVERAGGRVRLVRGERRNLKITYPEDLALAEALLAAEPT